MMNLALNLSQALSGGNLLALPLAIAGGVAAGMNPCCLALYPAAAGSCCSVSEKQTIRRSFGNAVAFVLGIAIAIAALGSIAAYVGRIAKIGTPVKYVIAVIPIFMGTYRLGWVKVRAFSPKPFQPAFGGAFGTGFLLSLVIGPCGTPVLASVLSYAAYKQSFVYGGLLLFLCALGTGLPLLTIAWNSLEGLVAVVAGALAGSISLVGFGIDSFIEVTSGSVLLWRMSVDADVRKRERREKLSLRIVGVCFLALAAYVGYESISDLVSRKAPEHSIPGIVLACVSLVVMPLLSRAKKKVGNELGSAAMHADAKQTDFCVYLSAILLLG